MKIIKITISALLLLSFANNAKSQATASATAEGTIITPISITKQTDLDFGNVAVSASLGTVILDGYGSRSATGEFTLPSTKGGPQEASFYVAGQPNYTISITLPSTHTITHTNNTDVMTVNSFVYQTDNGDIIDGGGFEGIYVGATLNVAGSQLPGVYTSAVGFDVTVNYN